MYKREEYFSLHIFLFLPMYKLYHTHFHKWHACLSSIIHTKQRVIYLAIPIGVDTFPSNYLETISQQQSARQSNNRTP